MATENALERFIRKTRELCAREPDVDKRWTALSPILAELLTDAEVREASKAWPNTGMVDGRAGNLLFYEDPDYGFAINGQVHDRPVGEPKGAHDHGHIYTLYGLLDGHERIDLYERTDLPQANSRPDYAETRKTSERLAGPGDIHMAKPYEIHTEVSIGERTTSVIVRSQKGGGFNQGRYNLATNHYSESLGPRQIPAEMLPKKAATAKPTPR